MELKPGYKQTEVGVIPEDWLTCKLHEITTSVSSGKSNTKSKTGKYPIYGSTGVIGFQNYFDYEGDKVLVARVGANAGTVNRVTGKYCVSDNTLMISYQNNVDIRFACYQLINRNLNLLVFGSGQPLITGGQLKELVLPFPLKKAEQTAIASALSDADALIQSLTRLIAKKRQIKQGAMQTLLNPYEKGRLKTGWVVKRLGDIASFGKGKGLPKSQLISDGEYECIHYGELFTKYKEKIDFVQNRTNYGENPIVSKSNDILMPTSDVTPNGLATASCLMKNGVILGGDILVIRSQDNVLDGVFFSYLVNIEREKVMQLVSGSTVYHLYGSDMAKFEFSMPVAIEEQTRIATILSDMDAEITALEIKLAKYQQIKQGMMQNLLTGRIRLVKPESKTGAVA